ncbi:uncharacterized protein LOC107469072 isoform X1 [Arachis duranensis]|uniref:Uncharacterized protein LOC107469072 isoform X1 n=1 Tax=Arachis duranensis TaxID=130453 RepID=A0A6P5MYW3_ARADU|nr:uncharacterized protein LOC107469072 isoform X1 [Arachis duranensis]
MAAAAPLAAGSGNVAAGENCLGHGNHRRRGCRGRNSSLLPLEVAVGLPLNRFIDRHCSGSAAPSSFVLLWLPREWLGAKVAVIGDLGLREEIPVTRLGYGIAF